jgi:predicted PurR-regulated permease PerM
VLAPRIVGGLTGFSPAAVLLVIYAAGSRFGIGGMLMALPVLMAIRTVFRVFVQNCENI